MIGFAVVFGLLAVFVAQAWLNNQAEQRMRSLEAQKKQPAPAHTIVVASKPLRFGNELTATGAARSGVAGGRAAAGRVQHDRRRATGRQARRARARSSRTSRSWPSKITGPGQRATLSAVIERRHEGGHDPRQRRRRRRAASCCRATVSTSCSRARSTRNAATNDVVLQNARVLAVDQIADERAEKPSVVKAVTLEVDVTSAQKIALAASVGTLSLMLRKAGEVADATTRRVTLSDLSNRRARRSGDSRFATIGVTRRSAKQEYSVPVESMPSRRRRASAPEAARTDALNGQVGDDGLADTRTWNSNLGRRLERSEWDADLGQQAAAGRPTWTTSTRLMRGREPAACGQDR